IWLSYCGKSIMGGPISKSIMGGPFMLVPKVVYGELMRLRRKEEDDVGWRKRTAATETMASFWGLCRHTHSRCYMYHF
nr:hypothetical protein [Tanacetum cinerariifolium]